MKQIKKRDGRLVEFNKDKIINAILAAFKSVDGQIDEYAIVKAENIADYIAKLAGERQLSVEEIQDYVEHGLMSTRRKDVAKAYILYREERTKERNKNSKLTKQMSQKLLGKNIENQNANIDEMSFGGRKGEATDIWMKQYALDNCMSQMSRNNHLNNEIYIHDLNSYACGFHNCLSIPFDDLLAKGFNTRQTDVRPANSVSTAFQLLAVIFQLQSLEQFGGVSATHLDWTMVPYVRKSFYKHYRDGLKYIDNVEQKQEEVSPTDYSIEDTNFYNHAASYKYAMNMTKQELEQAVQGMYHNLNTLQSRSGN